MHKIAVVKNVSFHSCVRACACVCVCVCVSQSQGLAQSVHSAISSAISEGNCGFQQIYFLHSLTYESSFFFQHYTHCY